MTLTPCPIQAFDFLGDGKSIRFQSENENEDKTRKKLRRDIAQIVRNYEEKSKAICEVCGEEGTIRMDMRWRQTLCKKCHNNYLKKLEERQKK